MNASGALCVTREELLALGRSRAGAIVTKSMTVEARQGNPLPRYYGFPGGSINSMGLPNLGYTPYAELIPELKRFGKPVIASVAGLCEDDFPTIAPGDQWGEARFDRSQSLLPQYSGKTANRLRRGCVRTIDETGAKSHYRPYGREAAAVF